MKNLSGAEIGKTHSRRGATEGGGQGAIGFPEGARETPGKIPNQGWERLLLGIVFFLFAVIFPAENALAVDLQPVPEEKAIQQYRDFWGTASPDPANHVVWKLYIFNAVPPSSGPGTTPEYLIAGLTPSPKNGYLVRIGINQLYNWLRPIPGRGDVIVAGARVLSHRDFHVTSLTKKEVVLKILTVNLDGAVSLPREHFDPSATPGTVPQSSR